MQLYIIYGLLSVACSIFGLLRRKNNKAQKIDAAIQKWTPIAYDMVNNYFKQHPSSLLGKGDRYITELSKILSAQGIKVTPEIVTQARAVADALHYQGQSAQAHSGDPLCGK